MKKVILIFAMFLFSIAQEVQEAQKEELEETKQEEKTQTLAQKKSGFLIGVEALFGEAFTHEENQGKKSSNFSVMGGVYGGYQHYFDENFGLRVLLSIHDGVPIGGKFQTQNVEIQTTALPFWVGTELDVMWDFWQEGEHTLGLSAGLGYNFELYRAREAQIGSISYSLSNLYQHNLYPILGFHYYYGHHQIGLNYRFIGTLNSPIKEEKIGTIPLKLKYTFSDYLNFSYTYRF